MDGPSILNGGTTTEGIATVSTIVTGLIGGVVGIVVKAINDYRRENHRCPKHCITNKPLMSKGVKKVRNAKSKG